MSNEHKETAPASPAKNLQAAAPAAHAVTSSGSAATPAAKAEVSVSAKETTSAKQTETAPKPAASVATTAPTKTAVIATAKTSSLASQAKPAPKVAKLTAAQAQAAVTTKRQQQMQYHSVRALRGNKADVTAQLANQNLSAPELAYVSAKVQALNATAVHVDLHSFTLDDSAVLQVNVRKLF